MATHPTFHTVLVTGSNSFLGGSIIDKLLSLYPGTKIHAAVRRDAAAAALKARYGASVITFIVPEIAASKAYDAAAANVTAIFHVASPMLDVVLTDAKVQMLDPAISGCLSALNAAANTASVKRVVLTSSVGAIVDLGHETGPLRPGYKYTEADWNPATYEEGIKLTDIGPAYSASKGLAEKAAWDFMKKEQRHFDLVAINPVETIGAYSGTATSLKSISATNVVLARLIEGEYTEVPPTVFYNVCTRDEVEQAHVAGLFTPAAAGHRFIVHNADYDHQRIVDVLHREFSDAEWIGNVPKGNPGQYTKLGSHSTFNPLQSQRVLGVEYGNWEQAVVDFCRKYEQDRKQWIS